MASFTEHYGMTSASTGPLHFTVDDVDYICWNVRYDWSQPERCRFDVYACATPIEHRTPGAALASVDYTADIGTPIPTLRLAADAVAKLEE